MSKHEGNDTGERRVSPGSPGRGFGGPPVRLALFGGLLIIGGVTAVAEGRLVPAIFGLLACCAGIGVIGISWWMSRN
jgi:hypothetical protein